MPCVLEALLAFYLVVLLYVYFLEFDVNIILCVFAPEIVMER